MSNTEVSHYDITGGGKILVFGDLHLSCNCVGAHKDYTFECYTYMGKILDYVKAEKAVAVFFLGDIVGVKERNIKDRQFFLRVILFFKKLNELTKGNVYSVKGNHDKGDFSDFDFLIGMGLLKNPSYVDYYRPSDNQEETKEDLHEARFHFVNYGDEDRRLVISEEESSYSNIVLGHSNYYIEGVTNWYPSMNDRVDLNRLGNFKGVELIVSGHIHYPSAEVLSTNIGEDVIDLFYTGAIGRTAERYSDCWYVSFEYENGSTEYSADMFGLIPEEKAFYPKEELIDEDTDEKEQARQTESLTNLVKEIMAERMTSGDLFGQVRAVPGASDRVKDIACDYLHRAIDMC